MINEMRLKRAGHISQRKLIEIMRVMEGSDGPMGARAISDCLASRGYDIGERAVRYNLKILDEMGFTRKRGYSGRVLTPLGLRELDDALVDDRIGFVNTRIEEYMFRTGLDLRSRSGDVIANLSMVDKAECERFLQVLDAAYDAGYTTSRRILLLEEGDGPSQVPPGCLGIATVCSITLDGLLLKGGIPVETSFAGVVEIRDGRAVQFVDLIAYAGTSIDPMRVFLARRVTSVAGAMERGSGLALANVREVPVAATDQARDLLDLARRAGLDGLLGIGGPGEPILGCPVRPGRIGIAFFAGVNGPVAAEELSIPVRTAPLSMLVDYGKMRESDGQE